MSGQKFNRRNGLSDDCGDNNRSLDMQKSSMPSRVSDSSSQSMDFMMMSATNQSTKALQNCDSFATDCEGYPPRVAVPSNNPTMRSSKSATAAHRRAADNVSSLMQNVAQSAQNDGYCVLPESHEYSPAQFSPSGYYGSQQTNNFNGVGMSGEPFMMGGMENVEIPRNLPNMRIDDYSGNNEDDGTLYYYDPEAKTLRPLGPEEMAQLIITKPNEADEDGGQSERNYVAENLDQSSSGAAGDVESRQPLNVSEEQQKEEKWDSQSQVSVADGEKSNEQQSEAEVLDC